MKSSAKDKLLKTASRLFYERGINATGIDLVIEKAGVAKASLYNSFGSKEALIVAYLAAFREDFEGQLSMEPEASVEYPFELLAKSVSEGNFHGCPFTNALTELPDSEPVQEQVRLYRESVRSFFSSRVLDLDLVSQLMLVYDGAFTSCKLLGDGTSVELALRVVRRLVQLGS